MATPAARKGKRKKKRTKVERSIDDGLLKGRLTKNDHAAIESLTADEYKQLTKILKKVKRAYPSGSRMSANWL